jgi:hypothetical protein
MRRGEEKQVMLLYLMLLKLGDSQLGGLKDNGVTGSHG